MRFDFSEPRGVCISAAMSPTQRRRNIYGANEEAQDVDFFTRALNGFIFHGN